MRVINLLIPISVLLLLFGVACGEDDNGIDEEEWQKFRDALPDSETLELDVPGEASEKRSAGDDLEQAYLAASLDEPGDMYKSTVQITTEVNFHILGMISWLDEITSYPPTSLEDGVASWGPFVASALHQGEMLITIEDLGGDHYKFEFKTRKKNTENPWTKWYYGEHTRKTTTARRGIGEFTVDFDALASVESWVDLKGKLIVDYDTFTDGRRIDIEYVQFQDPENDPEPFDATYHYQENEDLSGDFEFAAAIDIHQEQWGDAYPEKEDWRFNTRWESNGAGRSDVRVVGGDLDSGQPPISEVILSECWGEDFGLVFYTTDAVTVGGQTNRWNSEGSEANCVFETAELPDSQS